LQYAYGHHRLLPVFPTRRSSDLFAPSRRPGAIKVLLPPLLPPPLLLAVAPSGTAIVRVATIPSTRPRPPRPQSAFARRPLRPHIALARVSPPCERDPPSAFARVSLHALF